MDTWSRCGCWHLSQLMYVVDARQARTRFGIT